MPSLSRIWRAVSRLNFHGWDIPCALQPASAEDSASASRDFPGSGEITEGQAGFCLKAELFGPGLI